MNCEEAIKEQEYLIARRVRPLALIGHCESDNLTMLKIETKLDSVCSGDSISFVIDKGDGFADYGYASHRWIIDAYKFIVQKNSPVPKNLRGCLIGLMLGYGADAIARFHERDERSVCTQTNEGLCPYERRLFFP